MRGIFVLFFLVSTLSVAQNNKRGTIHVKKGKCQLSKTDKFVYVKVDSMPDFPGGGVEGDKWMRANLVYPDSARKERMTGKVMVSFIVMPDGKISNEKIISSTHKIFEFEAMRLVKKMPDWKPGKCNHEKVPVEIILPMNFGMGWGN
jgi:protein TonB